MTNNEAITHVPYLKWVVVSLRCGIDPDNLFIPPSLEQ